MANALLRYGGQGILYLLFAAFIGYFSTSPAYQHLAPDEALLRLSFRHPGQFATDCRQRSAEELAKLPPQLRAQMDCPRERSPVHVRVELDGKVLASDREGRAEPVSVNGFVIEVMERGESVALRVRDHRILPRPFAGIARFPVDPAWRKRARLVAHPS
ncbi:MAG: hypothetical protein EHM83_07780, partial [Burkholderiales bacterium]